MSDVVKFQNAGLPQLSIGAFRQGLQTARDTVAVAGNTPFLKCGHKDGIWTYGAEDLETEPGSLWAINPASMQTGVISWPPGDSKLKEPIKKMRHIFDAQAPLIDKTLLGAPANGGKWDDCIAFQLQCVGGLDEKDQPLSREDCADIDLVVEFQQNSWGGKSAWHELCKAMDLQSLADPVNIVPVVLLEDRQWQHDKWGEQHSPVFKIVRWLAMDGTYHPPGEPQQQQEQPQEQQQQQQPRTGRRARGAAASNGTQANPAANEPPPPAPSAQQPDSGVVRRRRRAAA